MDNDIAILRKAETLEHLDLETYDTLDEATAEEVSDAADRITARYHALMKGMPVLARVAMADAPEHPTEASVAKGAMMLTLIEEQTTKRLNEGVDLQSVHDNITDLLDDSHFFEILGQSAAACALAIYCQTAEIAMGAVTRRRNFTIEKAPHDFIVKALIDEHGYEPGDGFLLSRSNFDGKDNHISMLERILF